MLIAGCSQQPIKQASVQTPEAETPAAPTRPFKRETLYSLLAAEMAGSRKNYDLALSNYAQQARETKDPQVAERATLMARYLGDTDTALEASAIWLTSAPKNRDALSNATLAQLDAGHFDQAFQLSRQLLEQGDEPLFQVIAARASELSQAEHQALLAEFVALQQKHKHNSQLLVGSGLLLEQEQQYKAAMDYVRQALKLEPQNLAAAILEANLLHQLKRDKEALTKMENLLAMHPDNHLLRQQYARILIHTDMAQAEQEFRLLSQQMPFNGDIWLSLGIVALQRNDIETARQAFETLLDLNQHLATAHFYLGRIYEDREQLTDAALHYLQVTSGNDFYAATLSLLDIFVRKEDFESARQQVNRLVLRHPDQTANFYMLYAQVLRRHQLLDRANQALGDGLDNLPDNVQLLYARAMLNQERNHWPASEADLQQIIQLQPDNAQALNALGYLLADRGERLEEAKQLLTQALSLNPEDPAILDSMGWVEFRLGDSQRALDYLTRAYTLSADVEIGAHLGEVLWQLGREADALNIWRQCQKRDASNKLLQQTLTRLKVDL